MRLELQRLLTAVLPSLLSVGAAQAAMIDVGTHILVENTPGQVIDIAVAGGDLVDGANFRAEVGGGTSGPTITSVDLTSGFFSAGSPLQFGDLGFGTQSVESSVVNFGGGDLNASGLLAKLTIDTTGLSAGSKPWSLNLSGTTYGSTELVHDAASWTPTITNGSISLSAIPEPATLVQLVGLLGSGGLLGGYRLARRRKSRYRGRS